MVLNWYQALWSKFICLMDVWPTQSGPCCSFNRQLVIFQPNVCRQNCFLTKIHEAIVSFFWIWNVEINMVLNMFPSLLVKIHLPDGRLATTVRTMLFVQQTVGDISAKCLSAKLFFDQNIQSHCHSSGFGMLW
jgi:hypothetical protein